MAKNWMAGALVLACPAAAAGHPVAPPAAPAVATVAPATAAPSAPAANDRVRFAPVPAWVVPISVPAPSDAAGAIVLRLLDIQTRFDATGNHQFQHIILKVTAPEGLIPAGTVGVAWQPAFGGPVIHQVLIHRGAETIDVTKSAQFQVIRRESGLEALQIDGVLTAVLQIPDLRVGDELETSYTVDRRDPVLGDHHELLGAAPAGPRIDRLHLAFSWPEAAHMKWLIGDGLPKAKVAHAGGVQTVSLDATGFTAPDVPAGAPSRYQAANRLAASDFADWGAVARLMTPLFEKAATIAPGSPVALEAARIAAASPDPHRRASAALALVEGQVRYFANVDGLGGYVPQSADTVWAARNGDCKGKTVLLLALLRQLGITAEAALVSATDGDGVDAALPMPGRFNHVLVRATIGGKVFWLDGTRLGDTDIDRLAVPGFHWALPLTAAGGALEPLVATEPQQPEQEWSMTLDARAGVDQPAKMTGTVIYRGDTAGMLRTGLSFMDAAKRDTTLKGLWTEHLGALTVTGTTFANDAATGELRIGVTGTVKMDWSTTGDDAARRYAADYARLGQDLAPKRDAAVSAAVPVAVAEGYTVNNETVLLPDGGKGFVLDGKPIDQTIGGVHYTRTVTLKDGRFDMSATTRVRAGEISLADAQRADKTTDDLWNDAVYIDLPADTAAKVSVAGSGSGGSDGGDLGARSRVDALVRAEDYAGALTAADQLVAVHRTADNLIARGTVLRFLHREGEAADMFDAALALDRAHMGALRARANQLGWLGRNDDALILYDRMVLLHPDDEAVYLARAAARAEAQQFDGANRDYAIALDKRPDDEMARLMQITMLDSEGDHTAALAAADAFVKHSPTNATAFAIRGNILATMGQDAEARSALAQSLATPDPDRTADVYATRLTFGLDANRKDQLADALAIVKLDAARGVPTRALRDLAADPVAWPQLVAAYDAAVAADPSNNSVRAQRDTLDAVRGQPAKLIADTDKALADAKIDDPLLLNNACWARATWGVELDKALSQCTAALALHADAATLDSRGFVYLRKGDYPKAIADYDAALAKAPRTASSLYGRGIAKLRSGDTKGGQGDIAAARALSRLTPVDFAGYGVTP